MCTDQNKLTANQRGLTRRPRVTVARGAFGRRAASKKSDLLDLPTREQGTLIGSLSGHRWLSHRSRDSISENLGCYKIWRTPPSIFYFLFINKDLCRQAKSRLGVQPSTRSRHQQTGSTVSQSLLNPPTFVKTDWPPYQSIAQHERQSQGPD